MRTTATTRVSTAELKIMANRLRRRALHLSTVQHDDSSRQCVAGAEVLATLYAHAARNAGNDAARIPDTMIVSDALVPALLRSTLASADDPSVNITMTEPGRGLLIANGIALAHRVDGHRPSIYCLFGQHECGMGSVWEAAEFSAARGLDRVVAIVSIDATDTAAAPLSLRDIGAIYARRFEAFGWRTLAIDGNNVEHIRRALRQCASGRPTAIIATTRRSDGIALLEERRTSNDISALSSDDTEKSAGCSGVTMASRPAAVVTPRYRRGDYVATRDAFGNALVALGPQLPHLIVVDGNDLACVEQFAQHHPKRALRGHIGEQSMIGVALGLAMSGKLAVCTTFTASLSRAFDFVRVVAHGYPAQLILAGTNAGVVNGQERPGLPGLDDLGEFRALPGATILSPCDAVSTEHLTAAAAQCDGIIYLRLTGGKAPVIYAPHERFPIGGSKTLRASRHDDFTLVAAGVTVREALAAYDVLKTGDIHARVIDAYSIKPLDMDALDRAARQTRAIVVIEDHWADGGLGDAVAAALSGTVPVVRLAVTTAPEPAAPEEVLLDRSGISRDAIVDRVLTLATAA